MPVTSETINPVEQRHLLFMGLYKQAFPAVAKYISSKGGSLDEAKDIFQDALVVHYERTLNDNRPDNDTAYLFGIAKHLWLKRYKQKIKIPRLMISTSVQKMLLNNLRTNA